MPQALPRQFYQANIANAHTLPARVATPKASLEPFWYIDSSASHHMTLDLVNLACS